MALCFFLNIRMPKLFQVLEAADTLSSALLLASTSLGVRVPRQPFLFHKHSQSVTDMAALNNPFACCFRVHIAASVTWHIVHPLESWTQGRAIRV